VKNFSDGERELIGQILNNDQDFANYQSKELGNNNYKLAMELANGSNKGNKNTDDKNNGIGGVLAVVGVVSVLIISGIVVAKVNLFKKGKKK